MKLPMFTVLVSFMLANPVLAGQGHDQGGGGGGFCIGNVCKTLAEAGFKFEESDEPLPPILTGEVFRAVDEIHKKTFLGKESDRILRSLSMPGEDTFVRVAIKDRNKFEKARQQYIKLLKANKFPTKNFELFAFSDKSNGTTYLLPSFFKLNPVSKAKILLHEGFVRETGSIVTAIKFDIALESTLNGVSNLVGMAEALIEVYRERSGVHSLDWIESGFLLSAFVRDRKANTGKFLNLSVAYGDFDEFNAYEPSHLAYIYDSDREFWKFLVKYKISEITYDRTVWPIEFFNKELLPEVLKECQGTTLQQFLVPANDNAEYVSCDNAHFISKWVRSKR